MPKCVKLSHFPIAEWSELLTFPRKVPIDDRLLRTKPLKIIPHAFYSSINLSAVPPTGRDGQSKSGPRNHGADHPPKFLNRSAEKLRVAHGVHDVDVATVVLQRRVSRPSTQAARRARPN